jgi:group II intron reverse transcriptase/maturase
MLKAETTLRAINKLGEKNAPLTRVYRCLYNEELYLLAYGNLSRNKGALTAGVTEETIDGMNLKRIREIIELMRCERFNFKPARRVYIPKKNKGKRPLGLPTFSDKLVQEVVRLILEAYYEPQFSQHSHGFRPNKGCYTALKEVKQTFTGTTWFIEGDIKSCFTSINHDKLIEIISRQIHDGRFLNLIKRMLKAGYLEEWKFNKTYSGVPQGGVVTPPTMLQTLLIRG